ncbi:MAG: PD-(D/E)XK nuclease-like domain-containing protein [Actinomycetes bacterium]
MTTDFKTLIGVHEGMPAEQYHALPGASASILRTLWQGTPAHLRLYLDKREEPSPAMIAGTLAHHYALEPLAEPPMIIKKPETYTDENGNSKPWHGASKVCKTWEQSQKYNGFQVLSSTDFDNAVNAAKALSDHPITGPVLRDCKTELSLLTWDQTNNVGVRCRMDIIPSQGFDFLADCKFTNSVDDHQFPRHAYDMGYHIQAALYLFVWNALCGSEDRKKGFKFFAVESKPPHDVKVFACSDEFIAKGWEEVCQLLPTFAKCVRENSWPGSPATEAVCTVPKWV